MTLPNDSAVLAVSHMKAASDAALAADVRAWLTAMLALRTLTLPSAAGQYPRSVGASSSEMQFLTDDDVTASYAQFLAGTAGYFRDAAGVLANTTPYSIASATTIAVNISTGGSLNAYLTTGHNIALSFSNIPVGMEAKLLLIGGGSHTITLPSGYVAASSTIAVTVGQYKLIRAMNIASKTLIDVTAAGTVI